MARHNTQHGQQNVVYHEEDGECPAALFEGEGEGQRAGTEGGAQEDEDGRADAPLAKVLLHELPARVDDSPHGVVGPARVDEHRCIFSPFLG